MRRDYLLTAARWIFGLFYFSTGVAIVFAQFGFGSAPHQPTAVAQAFTDALTQSRFMDPLVALTYLLGGGALLIRRTAPMGIAILAPVVTVICCFHLVLSGQWFWGPLNLAWLLALAWFHRDAYLPLWHYVPKRAAI